MAYLAARLAADLAASRLFADLRGDFDVEALYGLGALSAANYYSSPTGGEAGDVAGFGAALLVQVTQLTTGATRLLAGRTSSGDVGWGVYLTTANNLVFGARNAAGTALVLSSTYTLTASDVGRVLALVGRYDGAGFLRLTVGRTALAALATTGYTPNSATPHQIGAVGAGAAPATGLVVLSHLTFRGTPTDAQVDALQSTARLLGDLPTTMQGATVTHRWSARDEARLLTPAFSSAPASLRDTTTLAAGDAMAKVGSPTLVKIDPAIDGRRTLGALGFSAANYLASPSIVWCSGSTGQGFEWCGRLDQQTGLTSATRVLFSAVVLSPLAGLQLLANTTNATLVLRSFTAANAIVDTPVYTVPASDIQRPLHVFGFWNATTKLLELYVNGVRIGTGTSMLTQAACTAVGYFGYGGPAVGLPNEASSFFGASYVVGDVSGAEALAAYTSWLSTGRPAGVEGKTVRRWDMTAACLAAGEAVPATVPDSVGTATLTRAGTGLTLAQRTERLFSYETSPILYGDNAFTDADYLQGSTGFLGNAASCWTASLFRVDAQSGSQARDYIGRSNLSGGWGHRTLGTNTSITGVMANTALSFITAPVGAILAADVGKLLLYIMMYDAAVGKIRAIFKRAELTAASIVGHAPAVPASVMRIGRNPNSPNTHAPGLTFFGAACGDGALTLAEGQALHDAVMASERMVGVPGKTERVINVDALGNVEGFTKVGSPAVAPVYARSFAW